MNKLLLDMAEFIQEAIETMEVNGIVVKPDAYKLLSEVQEVLTEDDLQELTKLIVQDCADYIRSNLNTDQAEPLAWNLEIQYGLHGDYAE